MGFFRAFLLTAPHYSRYECGMKPSFRTFAILFASFLGPIAAYADGRCILSVLENIESNRTKDVLIVTNDLSVPTGGKEIWYQSIDGTLKIQVVRFDARADGTEIQVNVRLKDVIIMRTAAMSHANFAGSVNAVGLPDGTAFSLNCVAQVR